MDVSIALIAIMFALLILTTIVGQFYLISSQKGLELIFLFGLILFPLNNIFVIRIGTVDTRFLMLFWVIPIVFVLSKFYAFLNSHKKTLPILLFLLFVVANFGSIITASYKFVAFRESIQFVYLFGVFLLTLVVVQGKTQAEKVARTFVYLCLIFSIYGLLEFIIGSLLVDQYIVDILKVSISKFNPGMKEQETLAGHLITRAESLNWGTVATAQYLLAFIFVILGFRSSRQNNIDSDYFDILEFISLGLGLLLLFFTYSRAGIFVFIICIALYFKYLKPGLKRLTIILAVLFVIIAFSNALFSSRIQEIGTTYEGSNAFHYAMYIAAFVMFLSNPILGVGSGNFIELVPEYTNTFLYKYVVASDAHNFVLQTLAEVGLIGIVPLSFALILVIKKSFYSKTDDNKERIPQALKFGFNYGFLAVILMALTMNGFKIEFFWIMLGFTFSLSSYSPIRLYEEKPK